MSLQPSSSQTTSKTASPTLIDSALNRFQAWALEHPDALCSKLLLPPISLIEGVIANQVVYVDAKRQAFGFNFCCAGQVVLGEFETLETALTSPQARDWRLGTSVLSEAHGPVIDSGGRNVFLLSLSDDGAGGKNHSAFRRCVQHYLINEAAIARQSDPVTQQLLENLADDYTAMPHGPGDIFFTDDQQGWKAFLVRYLHYVLFQIQPDDDAISTLTELHYTRNGTLHYFAGIGLMEKLNLLGLGKVPKLVEEVATIYEESPALANFQENDPNFNNMTRRELAKLMVSLLSIAGLQGPLHLGRTAMGYVALPAYKGHDTEKIEVTAHWDQLDLENQSTIELFLLECSRLFLPVSASHRVATEPFTVKIAGKERTFPAGTKVLIPMLLGMLNEDLWGKTAYEFNPQRENLCPYHMGFHSVGERHGGRICPGKDIALKMLTDVIQIVGKARRAQLA